MSEVKIVGWGVDTLVMNVCYADAAFQPVKRDPAESLQQEMEGLQREAREREEAVITRWSFLGIALYVQPKGSRGPRKDDGGSLLATLGARSHSFQCVDQGFSQITQRAQLDCKSSRW